MQKPSLSGEDDGTAWKGLPVIFDEVFTGLYRLGRFTASSFLQTDADISVHAKLLTGGVVPLCATLASESIFRAFASDDKTDALLHGHSYTAHAVGCQVALESLRQLRALDRGGHWDWAKGGSKKNPETGGEMQPKPLPEQKARTPPREGSLTTTTTTSTDEMLPPPPLSPPWSIWSPTFLDYVSAQKGVAGVWALGSVLSIHMDAGDGGAGYKSTAAVRIRDALRQRCESREEVAEAEEEEAEEGAEEQKAEVDVPWNVHSRVLGNVLYIMGSQTSTRRDITEIQGLIQQTIESTR